MLSLPANLTPEILALHNDFTAIYNLLRSEIEKALLALSTLASVFFEKWPNY
jgi:hypothetical protein